MRRILVLLVTKPVTPSAAPGAPVATTAPSRIASPADWLHHRARSANAGSGGRSLFGHGRPVRTRAIDAAHAKYPNPETLEDHQRYWGLLARGGQGLHRRTKNIVFPAELQATHRLLIKADTSFQERARAGSAVQRSVAGGLSPLSAAANDAADVVAGRGGSFGKGLGLSCA